VPADDGFSVAPQAPFQSHHPKLIKEIFEEMSQNAKLKANAEEQVTRLLTQLADLEELRGELDDDEYAETLGSTLQQLGEFRASLKRMAAGDITLLNELESIRMATQAAVSKAFKTPDILKMFALKQPTQLRERLEVIRRNHK